MNECNETLDSDGTSYTGCQSETKSGMTCQNWRDRIPEADYQVGNHNYCRNGMFSDAKETIWCWTDLEKLEWDYCQPRNNFSLNIFR